MPHLIIDRKNFEYSDSAFITDLTALLASDRLHHLRFPKLPGFNSQRAQFRLGEFPGLLAVAAQAPDEPLRHDRAYRGSDKKRLNTNID